VDKSLNIIDLNETSKENITCIKSKHLLYHVQTTICLHDDRDAVSNIIRDNRVWEESYLVKLLDFLTRYPQMDFIDVGANLGVYTMLVASYGRFVVSIECFRPNIERVRRAIQIEKLQDRVVIVGNAIFNESGKYLKMESNPSNVGSQGIIVDDNSHQSKNDVYVVKTIRFDDILPVLKAKNIRNAVMKVDIQWSEMYLCATGAKIFDYVNIPVILMEWDRVLRYRIPMAIVLQFLMGRGYVATKNMCEILDNSYAFRSWPSDIYWMKMNLSEIC
jgi:FkbM family methyltransferase